MTRLGTISYQSVSYCGLCAASAYLDDDDAAAAGSVAKLANQYGWRRTQAHGWLCLQCATPPRNSSNEKAGTCDR